MIKSSTPINFLKHIYSDSIPDIANILVAEADDDYDTIINYLSHLQNAIGKWIKELEEIK